MEPDVDSPIVASTTTSLFLRLPAELRLKIYSHTLSGFAFDVHCWRSYHPFGFATRILRKRLNFLALLAVNRQVHTETRLLPFQLNAFRFKSQDAFHSWLDKFSSDQQAEIREVCLVTWMARWMVEGEGWRERGLEDVVPLERLRGLRRLEVEVRMKRKVGECEKEECCGCKEHGSVLEKEEESVRKWLVRECDRVEVRFEKVVIVSGS
jgi:hypothetical protein